METDRFNKITEAQRICLRLVLEHCETKEIALRLGISPTAVVERLRLARHILGVSRSMDAARALAQLEGLPSKRLVDIPIVVECEALPTPILPSSVAGTRESGVSGVREEQAAYIVTPAVPEQPLALKIPLIGGVRDDLSPWKIVLCCVLAGALSIAAFGVLLRVSQEISISEHQR